MRRPLGYLLAWLLATVMAITGSWVGLQPLLGATSPQLPTRLAASQLRESLASSPAPVIPSRSPSPSPSPSPTGVPSPSVEPSPSGQPSPSPQPTATAPLAPMLPATSDWQELPDTRGYERTFVVRGGTVVFQVSRREVRVVQHHPNPGYEVSVNRWSRSSLILSFESLEHTSRIWVMWRNGPYAEVTETV